MNDKPAFPQYQPHPDPFSHGMTLRDYFAAKAMQALIDNDNLFFEIPTRAYEIADAMMAARSAK